MTDLPYEKVSETIWTSATNMARAGLEVTAIVDELEKQLVGLSDPFAFAYNDDDEIVDGGYVHNAYYFWGGLIAKGKRSKPFGYLTYGISFWRNEDEELGSTWPGACQSKIYIGYDTVDGGGWGVEDLFIRGDGQGYDENCKLCSPFLWECDGDEESKEMPWRDRAWFYALPLGKINNKADITEKLISPVVKLLSGEEVSWEKVGAYKFEV